MRSVIHQTRETHIATVTRKVSQVDDNSTKDAIWLLHHEKVKPFVQKAHFSDRLKYSSILGMSME